MRNTARITYSDTPSCCPSLQDRTRSTPALLAFVAVAFAWSRGPAFAGAKAEVYSGPLGTALLMAAGVGPSLAGFAVIVLFSTRPGLRVWLAHCLQWRIDWRFVCFGVSGAADLDGMRARVACHIRWDDSAIDCGRAYPGDYTQLWACAAGRRTTGRGVRLAGLGHARADNQTELAHG